MIPKVPDFPIITDNSVVLRGFKKSQKIKIINLLINHQMSTSYKDLGLVNTKEMFAKAVEGGYAVPAYNFNNLEQLQAIVQACVESKSPVILQVSSGARKYANSNLLRNMAKGAVEFAKELGCEIPIALHLDHGDTFELCKDCIDSGFSSVMIDGSHHSFEENMALTKKVVDYAHANGVTVEGELGGGGFDHRPHLVAGIDQPHGVARVQLLQNLGGFSQGRLMRRDRTAFPSHAVGTVDNQNHVAIVRRRQMRKQASTGPRPSQSKYNERDQSQPQEQQQKLFEPQFPLGVGVQFQKLHRPPVHHVVAFLAEQVRQDGQGQPQQPCEHPRIDKILKQHNRPCQRPPNHRA
jgi:hypothetical protein